MGLDMYLRGEKYLPYCWEHPEQEIREDGFRLESRTIDLGYWRKHPNLHGYIVEEFADGKDECQRIELSIDDLRQILEAVELDILPETSGFFFGESTPEDKPETVKILQAAIAWMEKEEPEIWKSVYYQASW